MEDLNKAYDIIKEALDNLKKRIGIVEPKFNDMLLEWVAKFDTSGGNIENNKKNQNRIFEFQKAVEKFLKDSGYNKMVNEFTVNFNELEQNQKKVQKTLNNINLTNNFMNPYKTWAIANVVAGMQADGLNVNVVVPLQNELFTSVNQGGSLKDLIKVVQKLNVSNDERAGILTKNVIQVSRDALGQYNGVVNEAIRKENKFDGILYVGSLVKDSRPQCEKWVNIETFGQIGLIPYADLQKEINWALNNGTGFIPSTTPETFCQNRGGFNCRHDAYPTRLKNFQ